MLLDEERQDPAERGLEQAAAEAVEGDECDEDPEAEVTGCVDRGEAGDHARPREIGSDQLQLARVAVGEYPADQQVVTRPSVSTISTIPRELALPVSVNARQPSATTNAASPI